MADARPAPFFLGDDPALDFLNTVGAPWGTEIEWLANGADLLTWLGSAKVVPEHVLADARARWSEDELDAVAGQARELREWYRGVVRDHAGRPIGRDDVRLLGPLNQLLAIDDTYRQIERAAHDDDGDSRRSGVRWRDERRWREPRTLLLPIAHAMGELLCEKDFALVRHCEGPTCTLWFHDTSKAHGRRWCSMAVCGNRAKAAAHRARLRVH